MRNNVWAVFFFILFSPLSISQSASLDSRIGHELNIRLDPDKHTLYVIDKITLPAVSQRELRFRLHQGLKPHSSTQGVNIQLEDPLQIKKGGNSLYSSYKLTLAPNIHTFILQYEGVIHHPLEAYGKEQARGFRSTPGLISPQGIYLAAGTVWYPQFLLPNMLHFTLSIELPKGWNAVSQGKRTHFEVLGKQVKITWDSPQAQEEIYLIAAPFIEYSRQTAKVESQVFLREADQKLANKYLDATERYLAMYEKLLGEYPYAKFALVENFWETGFGMPSFTLLGSKVIRLPFILNSSYPHEILHNWWGNGVYIDYASGNWSEGLTAYLADHLIKEQHGKGVAYRQQSLQKYSDYAAKGRDFPLAKFRSRHSSASEAVGYGKSLMLFHMLRQEIGDDRFINALQQFYEKHQFKTASFDDLRKSFDGVMGKDKSFAAYFDQWVNRTGAPALKLSHSNIKSIDEGFLLSFTLEQTQAGDTYKLRIPIVITLQGQENAVQTVVLMQQKSQQFQITLAAKPSRIDIDPEFDLFRKLSQDETPAAFTQVFGSKEMLVVLPRGATDVMRKAYRSFAQNLVRMGPDSVTLKWDDELDSLPKGHSKTAIVLLGWENKHIKSIRSPLLEMDVVFQEDALKVGEARLPHQESSVALTIKRVDNSALSLITMARPEVLPGLSRKLPHYHKYSYLGFSGNEPKNNLKGRWHVKDSSMTFVFQQGAKLGHLKKRTALITKPSNY